MIGRILGLGTAARQLGGAVGDVAEVFVGNRAARDAAEHERFGQVLAQYGDEFAHSPQGWFDQTVNGMNRLPRPMMAIGTLGLFAYAMADPAGFAERMQGLAYVPEPLWWLLGAVVSFYFGARELHHYRGRKLTLAQPEATSVVPQRVEAEAPSAPRPLARPASGAESAALPWSANGAPIPAETVRTDDPDFNAALVEWRSLAG
jgi:Holin of 3TMs, for gene-transfer release